MVSQLRKSGKTIIVVVILIAIVGLWQCSLTDDKPVYAAVKDGNEYIGINTCMQCHPQQFQSFQHTGMGQSFGNADTLKSAGQFDSNFIYDPFSGYHYQPYWENGELFVKEFLTSNEKQTFSRTEKVSFIIGSGQHTNSHLQSLNGYVHQMPFTFYTQDQKLDLPPGFEEGQNSRFSRKVGLECMSCHNAMPTGFVLGSENKYEHVPLGIDCERCHGPGKLHVEKIQRGELTDTASSIDYSIVNPKHLTTQQQFEICQRCHLQGNAVLADGKSFFDFKPSMALNEVMDIYLPRYTDSDDEFIMASHVDRFKLSKCFQSDNTFSCTSCHNPHVSIKETNIKTFNKTCNNCHKEKECAAPLAERELKSNNCVTCHMPRSGSIDIPHVSVHDHFIRKPITKTKSDEIRTFIKLEAINNTSPSKRSKIRGYLQHFEKFKAEKAALDSAQALLQSAKPDSSYFFEWILYYHLSNMPFNIQKKVQSKGIQQTLKKLNKQDYSNKDAWTSYRIGEAYYTTSDYKNSLLFYVNAAKLAPYNLEFKNKLGSVYTKLELFNQAKNQFKNIIDEYPNYAEAHNNLGYIYMVQQNFDAAEKHISRALELDPKYSQARLNYAGLYLALGEVKRAKKLLFELLEDEPDNQKVLATLDYLQGINE